MTEIRYPIRKALRAQEIKQEDLAKKLGKSRQTLARYLNQYETMGYASDTDAQKEFDRIMASEKQRLNGLKDNSSRLAMAKMALSNASEQEKNSKVKYDRFLRDVLRNHPDIAMIDYEGNPVTEDTLDLEKMWVNFGFGDNDELEAAMTDDEKARLEEIQREDSDRIMNCITNSRIEEACIIEQLWDSTESAGKPTVYSDRFEYALSDEVGEDEMYHFGCETFCMCFGDTARIYADHLMEPDFEHNVQMEVFAVIEVVTDRGMMYIDTVKLERPGNNPFRYIGEIGNLIPGYKYVYSLGITAGDYDEVNDLEYTLLEGYSAKSHPLK